MLAVLVLTLAPGAALGVDSIGALDLRRKEQIAIARATDHADEVILAEIPGFNLSKSIFGEITSPLARAAMTTNLEWRPFWLDAAAKRISDDYAQQVAASPPPSIDPKLIEFMNTKCDFKIEHADGSFLDHLRFCYDYSAAHYRTASPIPSLLHSIMGVGTNYFPMNRSLIPELQTLVSREDFHQIESFPTFLRYVIHRGLIRELAAMSRAKLDSIVAIKYYRVIDNRPLRMTADEMWVQLNYQMLHALDFLPTAYWDHFAADPFLGEFDELYSLLSKASKLQADVRPSLTSNFTDYSKGQPPESLFSRLTGWAPKAVQASIAREEAAKQVAGFSRAIGHNFSYEFEWPRGKEVSSFQVQV